MSASEFVCRNFCRKLSLKFQAFFFNGQGAFTKVPLKLENSEVKKPRQTIKTEEGEVRNLASKMVYLITDVTANLL